MQIGHEDPGQIRGRDIDLPGGRVQRGILAQVRLYVLDRIGETVMSFFEAEDFDITDDTLLQAGDDQLVQQPFQQQLGILAVGVPFLLHFQQDSIDLILRVLFKPDDMLLTEFLITVGANNAEELCDHGICKFDQYMFIWRVGDVGGAAVLISGDTVQFACLRESGVVGAIDQAFPADHIGNAIKVRIGLGGGHLIVWRTPDACKIKVVTGF